MPTYNYFCEKCAVDFDIFLNFANYKEIQPCPKCKKESKRVYDSSSLGQGGFIANKELKTLGDLAKKNTDKMSDDQKAKLKEKNNEYRNSEPAGDLPSNMSRIERPKNKPKWY